MMENRNKGIFHSPGTMLWMARCLATTENVGDQPNSVGNINFAVTVGIGSWLFACGEDPANKKTRRTKMYAANIAQIKPIPS
jgi:peptidoglycan/LPS O-acetylase OafA/YrhL